MTRAAFKITATVVALTEADAKVIAEQMTQRDWSVTVELVPIMDLQPDPPRPSHPRSER